MTTLTLSSIGARLRRDEPRHNNLRAPFSLMGRIKHRRGMTMVELMFSLALIIIVMSVLIGGFAYAFKIGKQRASAARIRNIQSQMRTYAASKNPPLVPGDSLTKDDLVGTGKAFETEPLDPATGASYTWGTTVPANGTAFVQSTDADVDPGQLDN